MNNDPLNPAPEQNDASMPVEQPVLDSTPAPEQNDAFVPVEQQPIIDSTPTPVMEPASQPMPSVTPAMSNPAAAAPKQKKKWLVPAILGGVVAIAAVIVVVILMSSGGGNGGGGQRGGGVAKNQEFFNTDKASDDAIGYVFDYASKNFFVGVKQSDVARDLRITRDGLLNDKRNGIKEADGDDFWVYDEDHTILLNTEYENGTYAEKDGKKTFASDEIVFSEGNYVITKRSSLYLIYYKVIASEGYSKGTEQWLTIQVGLNKSLEEAKKAYEKLKPVLTVCSFEKNETIDKCDGWKNYNFVHDIVMEDLNRWGLYLSSYKEINRPMTSSYIVEIVKPNDEGEYSSSQLSFEVGVKEGTLTDKQKSERQEFQMNGRTFFYKDSAVLTEKDGNIMAISIDLPYGTEKTDENYLKEFKAFFSNES